MLVSPFLIMLFLNIIYNLLTFNYLFFNSGLLIKDWNSLIYLIFFLPTLMFSFPFFYFVYILFKYKIIPIFVVEDKLFLILNYLTIILSVFVIFNTKLDQLSNFIMMTLMNGFLLIGFIEIYKLRESIILNLPKVLKIVIIQRDSKVSFLMFNHPNIRFYDNGVSIGETFLKSSDLKMFEDNFGKPLIEFTASEFDLVEMYGIT